MYEWSPVFQWLIDMKRVWVSDGLYVGANTVRQLANGRTLFAPTYIIPKHKKEP